MSSWILKVISFRYVSPPPTFVNGMLRHDPYFDHDRFMSTRMDTREEARSLEPDDTVAWKRRRKRRPFRRQVRSPPESTSSHPGDRRSTSSVPFRPPPNPSRRPPNPSGLEPGTARLIAGTRLCVCNSGFDALFHPQTTPSSWAAYIYAPPPQVNPRHKMR